MKIRLIKDAVVNGVEYRCNTVLDIADKAGAALVKAGAANEGDDECAAGLAETGSVVNLQVAPEKAVAPPAK